MRVLFTLNIRDVAHLCKLLGTSEREIKEICTHPERHYIQGDRVIKGKRRHIATPQGRLRSILDRLQDLLQRVALPATLHGGRKGCSNISNAREHVGKPIVARLDVKDFFPSITHKRIYSLFVSRLGCSPDVARYLTRLTTLNGSLPQGSPTSTILAVLASESLSHRLERLSGMHGVTYTQYVDDITLSGAGRVARLVPLVCKIVRQESFKINPSKTKVLFAEDAHNVTGVRVNQQLDIPREKVREVRSLLASLGTQATQGISPSEPQIASLRGKIRYMKLLNKGAGRFYERRLKELLSRRSLIASSA